jgi:hypothetical protein
MRGPGRPTCCRPRPRTHQQQRRQRPDVGRQGCGQRGGRGVCNNAAAFLAGQAANDTLVEAAADDTVAKDDTAADNGVPGRAGGERHVCRSGGERHGGKIRRGGRMAAFLAGQAANDTSTEAVAGDKVAEDDAVASGTAAAGRLMRRCEDRPRTHPVPGCGAWRGR